MKPSPHGEAWMYAKAKELLLLLQEFSCIEPQVFDPDSECMTIVDFMDYLDSYAGGTESQTQEQSYGYEDQDDEEREDWQGEEDLEAGFDEGRYAEDEGDGD